MICPGVALGDNLTVEGDARLVSDYRFRGVSASLRRPALQVSVDIRNDTYIVGAWASTTSNYEGAHSEIDLYAGLHREIGATELTLSTYAFVYPSGRRVNSFDIEGSYSRKIANVRLETLMAWSPKQRNLAKSNIYIAETATILLSNEATKLVIHYGWENGLYKSKHDYSLVLMIEAKEAFAQIGIAGSSYGKVLGANARPGPVIAVGMRF